MSSATSLIRYIAGFEANIKRAIATVDEEVFSARKAFCKESNVLSNTGEVSTRVEKVFTIVEIELFNSGKDFTSIRKSLSDTGEESSDTRKSLSDADKSFTDVDMEAV